MRGFLARIDMDRFQNGCSRSVLRGPISKSTDYPNHTQQVEAAVRVVSDAATKRADHNARDNLIHHPL